MIDLGLAPLLKQAGFCRHSTHFARSYGEALDVVNAQSGQWNMASSGKFTLNIGVHFSSVAIAMHGKDPMPAIPKEYYCLMRRRVGMLLPGGADCWWTITPQTDIGAVAAELASAWKDFVSPWLDKVKTIADAAAELEQRGGVDLWAAAAARLVLGEREKAAQIARVMLDYFRSVLDASHPANKDHLDMQLKQLRQWAASHNLPGLTKHEGPVA